jgi:hypothetical protein
VLASLATLNQSINQDSTAQNFCTCMHQWFDLHGKHNATLNSASTTTKVSNMMMFCQAFKVRHPDRQTVSEGQLLAAVGGNNIID